MQTGQQTKFSGKKFVFINRISGKVFVLPYEEEPKNQEYKSICPTLSKIICKTRTNGLNNSLH